MAFDATGFGNWDDGEPGQPADRRGGIAVPAAYVGVMVAATVATLVLIGWERMTAAADAAGPDLTRLLLAMAATKVALVGAVASAVVWRLSYVADRRWLLSYCAAGVAMATGLASLAGLTAIAFAAVAMHSGLIATLILLHSDPLVQRRLKALLKRRVERARR